MKQQYMNIGLLNIFAQLYHQLVSRVISLFRRTPRLGSNPNPGDGLVGRVHLYINSRQVQKEANIPAIIHANKVESSDRVESPPPFKRPVVAMSNSFSEALSERHSTDALNDTAGHKLVQSVMDHLHSSVRYARKGDTERARLHADIMKDALKEAKNFVSEDQYGVLVRTLDDEFRSMTRSTS